MTTDSLEREREAELGSDLEAADHDEMSIDDAAAGPRIEISEAPASSDERERREEAARAARAEAVLTPWEDLFERGDVDALLARAAAYRLGEGVEECLEESLASYQAAAELGSAKGHLAVAMFHLTGVGMPVDLTAGMGKLRLAARAGSLGAKVYLGNIYELGTGREEPERDKADVWYRAVARAAGLEGDETDPAFVRAMADLGCIRHTRPLLADESLAPKERHALLRKVKPLGYGLHQRLNARQSLEEKAIEAEIAEAMAASEPSPDLEARDASEESTPGEPEARRSSKPRSAAEPEARPAKPSIGPAPPTLAERFQAFVLALFFAGSAIGLSVALMQAATDVLARGESVPVVGTRTWLILPIFVAASLLPILILYRLLAVLVAVGAALVMAAAGHELWQSATAQLFSNPTAQAQGFGAGGLIVALLIIGLLGGTRKRRWRDSEMS